MRYGELLALARRHVDLDAGTVRVERALEQVPGQPIGFGKTKTDKSRRVVHLPAFVVDTLGAHVAEHADALLFPMPRRPDQLPINQNREPPKNGCPPAALVSTRPRKRSVTPESPAPS